MAPLSQQECKDILDQSAEWFNKLVSHVPKPPYLQYSGVTYGYFDPDEESLRSQDYSDYESSINDNTLIDHSSSPFIQSTESPVTSNLFRPPECPQAIYQLSWPDHPYLYIGISNDPTSRLRQHITDSHHASRNAPLYRFMRTINPRFTNLTILEQFTSTRDFGLERESHWIHILSQQHPLLNTVHNPRRIPLDF